jgi:uncharacterized protein (DUF1697 family)
MATRRAASSQPQRQLALLRGINVGGNRRVPMEQLRALATGLGLEEVSTFIASGNLLFTSAEDPRALEPKLEAAIEEAFGFFVDVLVRTADAWDTLAASNPFTDAATARANLLHLGLAKAPLAVGAQATLRGVAVAPERLAVVGQALWLDYASGVARSKLTPKVLDRAVGSTVTARNWKTVSTLSKLLRGEDA